MVEIRIYGPGREIEQTLVKNSHIIQKLSHTVAEEEMLPQVGDKLRCIGQALSAKESQKSENRLSPEGSERPCGR